MPLLLDGHFRSLHLLGMLRGDLSGGRGRESGMVFLAWRLLRVLVLWESCDLQGCEGEGVVWGEGD